MGESNSVSITIRNSGDTIPPVVSITSPRDGSRVGCSVMIRVVASDNVKVTQVSLYIDNVLKAVSSSSRPSWSWNTSRVAAGTHVIKATATDAAGTVGTTSISVRK